MPAYCDPWPVNSHATCAAADRIGEAAAPRRASAAAQLVVRGADRPRRGQSKWLAPDVRRVADVGERHVAAADRAHRRSAAPAPRSASASCADSGEEVQRAIGERPRAIAGVRTSGATCCSSDDVRVGAAEAERADAGAARAVRRRPAASPLGRHRRPAATPTGCSGFGVVKVQGRRDHAVLERQHGLDQPGDAGGRLEVADVGLDRADRRPARSGRRRAPPPARRPRSDRRATCRCRAPRRSRSRPAPRRRPRARARITCSCAGPLGAVRPLLRPSWLTALPRITRETRSPSATRIAQPLEHHDAAAFAAHVAVGRRVEGLAAAVGAIMPAFENAIVSSRRQDQVDAAGQRGVALAARAGSGTRVHRDQRRRAGGVDRQARPVEAEEIGQPAGWPR